MSPLREFDRSGGNTILKWALACLATLVLGLTTFGPALAKDTPPISQACDPLMAVPQEHQACVSALASSQDTDELFYAGYWMAKDGHPEAALRVLSRVKNPDAAVLTYLGYASRKLGRLPAALGYYNQALQLTPDNAVTRAYLGEAHISLGNRPAARAELTRIAAICGTSCPAYRDLATALENARP
ncbi:MAG: tetratricopeptide repeat protein [Pseudomonadota bacterium]